MYYNCIKKSHQPSKFNFRTHYLGVEAIPLDARHTSYVDVVAIDPGTVHLGIRIERRFFGPPIRVQTLWMELINIASGDNDKQNYAWQLMECFYRPQFQPLWFNAHYFLIEWQMAIGYRNVIVSKSIIMLLTQAFAPLPSNIRQHKIIQEIDPDFRVKALSGPTGAAQNQIKSWSANLGLHILKNRQDFQAFNIIFNKASRKHDLTDMIIMIEAVCLNSNLGSDINYYPQAPKVDSENAYYDAIKLGLSKKQVQDFLSTGQKLGYFNLNQ